MSLTTVLIIVLVLVLLGVLPVWPHARSLGVVPSAVVGVILLVFLVLWLTGRL